EQIKDSSAQGVTQVTEDMRQMLRDYPVGGVCLFGKNIVSPEQLAAFNADLQAASDLPLFLAVDEEGGAVARLANHPAFTLPKYESAAAVAALGAAEVEKMGRTIGAYLKTYGFQVDFAPVADVNTNPANPAIGERAFSADSVVAAEMAAAMARGVAAEGILPTFKHFPGHGDTAEDSHTGGAVTYRTLEEMRDCELLPFQPAGLDAEYAVMVSHITAPNLLGSSSDGLPASLSPQIVGQVLRGELGFQGLVITDSLSMQAITDRYSASEAAVMALEAGCDMLLMPDGLAEAFEAVQTAVLDGTLPEQRVEESVRRILRYKQSYGLLYS
ncbi:MAG: glycoside hydrolase family 3 N-terminal domain-containing protein, partial [Gemmiger sp.]